MFGLKLGKLDNQKPRTRNMPEVEVRRLHPTDPELTLLEAKIIAQRNEYASLDFPEYQHIYLGFIEGRVVDLLAVLEAEVYSTRAEFPATRFTLEYHPSCIAHTEYPFLVYSFTLTKIIPTEQGSQRQLMIMSWKLPRKAEYTAENAAIEHFMADKSIQKYDDGSGVVCKIEPEVRA
jgi:hypothetical protein